jgi:hypothetical protein
MVRDLSEALTNDEIKNAVFSMGPWKAPGPDGFPAGFYQKSWEIVGSTICEFVRKIWTDPQEIGVVNKTDICLIPKVQYPETVAQFRPISLCNTNYKIVSKVIVGRLKACIPLLVSPFQTGFVPGRNIHENIVVAKEMIHTMNRMKSKKGAFAIKVDLSKAYDKISWECIWRILCEIRLPTQLINLIMHSITSVETNVKWNGARGEFFKPQRGIRQGDPISPYLFVLCMDKLSHLIIHAVNSGKWRGIKAGREGPMVSHLMFADDLLLFGEATEKQMQCVLDNLNQFCNLSGQEVSYEKTSILFSKNVRRSMRDKLINMSGMIGGQVTDMIGGRGYSLVEVGWKPPVGSFVRLNTDEARKNDSRTGCGGVIRGNQGEWLGGFAKGVGNCSAFMAELWGVFEGLALAKRMGLRKIELHIDSAVVV